MSDEPIYRPGRLIAGRYRITSALSQGGMGAVYLAQQVSLGRDVALKVILERGSDPELLKRFDVEARAVCQLKHPNIITYHDYGRDEDGHPFLVMEFLAGYPGSKLIHGERRPAVEDLVHVIAQVCSALDEAHRKGIIHRDLKWSNVMICPQGRDPYFAKLIDFGIMKVATDGSSGDQRGITRTGMLLGTPEYMSPEAICGMPVDGRADQYSLAIMLWEALEGRRPFDAPSHFELLRMQVQDPPPPLERGAAFLEEHPGLALVLARALEKHPDDRFESILDFQRALLAAVGEERAPSTAKARPGARGQQALAMTPAAPARETGSSRPLSARNAAPNTPRPVATQHELASSVVSTSRPHKVWWLAALAFVVSAGLVLLILKLTGTETSPEQVAAAPAPAEALQGDPASIADTSQPDTSGPTPDIVAPEAALASPDSGPSALAADIALAAADTTGPDPAAEKARPDTMVAPDTTVAPDTMVAPDSPDTMVAKSPDTTAPGRDIKAAGATPTAATRPKEPEKTAKPAQESGAPARLMVDTKPWSFVSLDGGPAVESPLVRDLPPGRYTVTIRQPTKYASAHTFTVTIKSGQDVYRSFKLDDILEPTAK